MKQRHAVKHRGRLSLNSLGCFFPPCLLSLQKLVQDACLHIFSRLLTHLLTHCLSQVLWCFPSTHPAFPFYWSFQTSSLWTLKTSLPNKLPVTHSLLRFLLLSRLSGNSIPPKNHFPISFLLRRVAHFTIFSPHWNLKIKLAISSSNCALSKPFLLYL